MTNHAGSRLVCLADTAVHRAAEQTHLGHAGKIRKGAEAEGLRAGGGGAGGVCVGRRAWATGDSPKAIFAHAVGWHPLPRHQPGQRGHPRQQHIPLAHEGGMSEYRHYSDWAEVERAEYEAGL